MAEKNDGWIKLERSIRDLPFWDEKPFSRMQAYIDLRLMVNHKDAKILIGNTVKIIRAGQHYTSVSKLAKRWGWTRSRVHRYLDLLESIGLCHANVTPNGTTLTIVNTGVVDVERNTYEPPNETTNSTTNDTTNGTQTRMNKNDIRMIHKNEKEEPAAQSHFLVGEDGKVVLNSRGEPVEV